MVLRAAATSMLRTVLQHMQQAGAAVPYLLQNVTLQPTPLFVQARLAQLGGLGGPLCLSPQASLKTITDIDAARAESTTAIFDGEAKAVHRDRAAHAARRDLLVPETAAASRGEAGRGVLGSYLREPLLASVAERLLDRLLDCKARTFLRVVVVGGAAVHVLERLAALPVGVEHVTVLDTSPGMLRLVEEYVSVARRRDGAPKLPDVSCSLINPSHELLPLEPGTHDLVISALGLHWFNDLPTVMAQCRFALRDDGLFLAALFAGETLQELRISCALAQMERQGGVSPVVSPFARVRDGGNLLTRAGLALPSVDMDEWVVRFGGGPTDLVTQLRAMGEVNAVLQRQRIAQRDTALAAGAIYQAMYGSQDDGSVPATFQVMFLTGWAPHESQQKPAQRGSATVSFQELADGLIRTGGASVAGGGNDGDEDPNPKP